MPEVEQAGTATSVAESGDDPMTARLQGVIAICGGGVDWVGQRPSIWNHKDGVRNWNWNQSLLGLLLELEPDLKLSHSQVQRQEQRCDCCGHCSTTTLQGSRS